ncbi:MAG: hypothetical protein AAFR99_00205, partial [Cyanobacteria bacterium J06629_9]
MGEPGPPRQEGGGEEIPAQYLKGFHNPNHSNPPTNDIFKDYLSKSGATALTFSAEDFAQALAQQDFNFQAGSIVQG